MRIQELEQKIELLLREVEELRRQLCQVRPVTGFNALGMQPHIRQFEREVVPQKTTTSGGIHEVWCFLGQDVMAHIALLSNPHRISIPPLPHNLSVVSLACVLHRVQRMLRGL